MRAPGVSSRLRQASTDLPLDWAEGRFDGSRLPIADQARLENPTPTTQEQETAKPMISCSMFIGFAV